MLNCIRLFVIAIGLQSLGCVAFQPQHAQHPNNPNVTGFDRYAHNQLDAPESGQPTNGLALNVPQASDPLLEPPVEQNQAAKSHSRLAPVVSVSSSQHTRPQLHPHSRVNKDRRYIELQRQAATDLAEQFHDSSPRTVRAFPAKVYSPAEGVGVVRYVEPKLDRQLVKRELHLDGFTPDDGTQQNSSIQGDIAGTSAESNSVGPSSVKLSLGSLVSLTNYGQVSGLFNRFVAWCLFIGGCLVLCLIVWAALYKQLWFISLKVPQSPTRQSSMPTLSAAPSPYAATQSATQSATQVATQSAPASSTGSTIASLIHLPRPIVRTDSIDGIAEDTIPTGHRLILSTNHANASRTLPESIRWTCFLTKVTT